MKLLSSIIYFYFLTTIGFSQPPIVQWEKGLGGSNSEFGNSIIQQSNGNFLICGYTNSTDFDVVGNHNFSNDLWFLNLNDSGVLTNNKCYGGTWVDEGKAVLSSNNQLMLFGTAGSQDYDLAGVHSMAFGEDLWLLKIDSALDISFQKTFGSAGDDKALKMICTNDGGYVFLGKIQWRGNDVDTNYGNTDLWATQMDSLGNIRWQITLGSTSEDEGGDIVEAKDGGYLVVGGIAMNSGNVSCVPNSGSLWLVKLNLNGQVVWQKCFSSAFGKKVLSTNDGGFVIAAVTFDSTIAGYSGYSDYLLFKIDSLGNQQWAHCYGGTQFDIPNDLIQCADGGFLAAGTSDSYDFYASSSHGAKDALLVKIDSLGNFQWSECYGSWGDDICNSIIETSDGGLAITGSTNSWIGLPAYGMEDLWVLKLNYTGNGIFTPDNSIEQFNSFATAEGIEIELTSKKRQYGIISIFDISGRKIFSKKSEIVSGRNKVDLTFETTAGIYLVQLETNDGRAINKLFK